MLDSIETLREFFLVCVNVLGVIAVFCGACMAGAAALFWAGWVVLGIRERWRWLIERRTIWSPSHYSADSDFVVLPRSYFEELLPAHLQRAWVAILNRFRHQPWPPLNSEVTVSVRDRSGKFRKLTHDDLEPRK